LGYIFFCPYWGEQQKKKRPSFSNTSEIGYTQLNDDQNDSFLQKKDPKVRVQLQTQEGQHHFTVFSS